MPQATSANWGFTLSGLLKRCLWAVAGTRTTAKPDRRLNRRARVHFKATIFIKSAKIHVRGVDVHSGGALVTAWQLLAPETVLFIHLKSFGLVGFAQVRHCRRQGLLGYAIGLEFPAPLMREEAGSWQFHRFQQTDGGWSKEWEASMNLGTEPPSVDRPCMPWASTPLR